MKPITKRTQKDYSLAFKLSVVDKVEKGECTYKQAQNHYGIQGSSTVLTWLRRYGQLDRSKGTPNHMNELPLMSKPNDLTPEQKIKALEKELEDTKIKAQFFETIVDVLDKDFGVRITKKQRNALLKKKT
ncbi:helix-turn-helix domain-containing protein [Catenovulum sp. SM1970]|nr:helix-turn-helix domain-containing protein [Marinifaba aquimaris]